MSENRAELIFQTVKGFIHCVIVLLLSNLLFPMKVSVGFILSVSAVGGLLSLLYAAILFGNKKEYDGKLRVSSEEHTLSININGSVEEMIDKGKVVLKVEDISA